MSTGSKTTDRITAPLQENAVFATISDLVDMGSRRTGTPAGQRAAAYVAERFRRAGLVDVRLDAVASSRWDARRAALRVAGHSVDCYPVAHSGVSEGTVGDYDTGPDGLTTRLVDLGDPMTDAVDLDLDLAVDGSIVMFDVHFGAVDIAEAFGGEVPPEMLETKFGEFYQGLPDGKFTDPYHSTLPDSVAAAKAAGAVAFVAVLSDYFNSNEFNNENFGGLDLPGLWVTSGEADRLRSLIDDEPDTRATLDFECRVEPASGYSPIGFLPGKSDETILIHSHHDSVTDGAVEDASGTAVVIALAEHFASLPLSERPRTLMFATMDTHFTGYEAHTKFVSDYVTANAEGRELLVDVVIEHVARAARVENDELVLLDEPSPRIILTNVAPATCAMIEEEIQDLTHIAVIPTAFLPGEEMPSDGDFTYRAGLPVLSYLSAPVYLYDNCDTLDKIDRSQLGPVADTFARIVAQLSSWPRDEFLESDGIER